MTKRVIIGLTGSVAAIKLLELIDELQASNEVMSSQQSGVQWKIQLTITFFGPSQSVEIRVVVTERAKHFVNMSALQSRQIEVFTDADEWSVNERYSVLVGSRAVNSFYCTDNRAGPRKLILSCI